MIKFQYEWVYPQCPEEEGWSVVTICIMREYAGFNLNPNCSSLPQTLGWMGREAQRFRLIGLAGDGS